MSPKAQLWLGIVLIAAAIVLAIFGATKHSWVALIVLLVGALGGQMIGQANARGRR